MYTLATAHLCVEGSAVVVTSEGGGAGMDTVRPGPGPGGGEVVSSSTGAEGVSLLVLGVVVRGIAEAVGSGGGETLDGLLVSIVDGAVM